MNTNPNLPANALNTIDVMPGDVLDTRAGVRTVMNVDWFGARGTFRFTDGTTLRVNRAGTVRLAD